MCGRQPRLFPHFLLVSFSLFVSIPVSQIWHGVTFPETRCNETCFLFVCLFLQWLTGTGLGNKVAFAWVSLVFFFKFYFGTNIPESQVVSKKDFRFWSDLPSFSVTWLHKPVQCDFLFIITDKANGKGGKQAEGVGALPATGNDTACYLLCS